MKSFKQFLIESQKLDEYVSNEIIYLKKYINMSDEEKKEDLFYKFAWLFKYFVRENVSADVIDPVELGHDMEGDGDEIKNKYGKTHPEVINDFKEYLWGELLKHDLPGRDEEFPSWYYFSPNPKVFPSQWLIHFTNEGAKNIAREGFRYGVDDYTQLGLTTQASEKDKEYGGYNFAYLISDFEKYGRGRSGSYVYGEEAVVFTSSGISTWHEGDGEPQVIFYGKFAQNIVPIFKERDEYVVHDSKTRRVIYKNEELPRVVDWIIQNFQQYHRKLVWK